MSTTCFVRSAYGLIVSALTGAPLRNGLLLTIVAIREDIAFA